MVFNEHTMQERPPCNVQEPAQNHQGRRTARIEVANVVAHAMKEGHREGPRTSRALVPALSGITSEKHDSFLDPVSDGRAIMSFSERADPGRA